MTREAQKINILALNFDIDNMITLTKTLHS